MQARWPPTYPVAHDPVPFVSHLHRVAAPPLPLLARIEAASPRATSRPRSRRRLAARALSASPARLQAQVGRLFTCTGRADASSACSVEPFSAKPPRAAGLLLPLTSIPVAHQLPVLALLRSVFSTDRAASPPGFLPLAATDEPPAARRPPWTPLCWPCFFTDGRL
jgi:hypothetical protein